MRAVAKSKAMAARARRSPTRSWWRRIKIAAALAFLGVVVLCVLGAARWKSELEEAAHRVVKLPDLLDQLSRTPSVILARDGEVLLTIQTEYREPVRIDEVPTIVKQATLAAEDKRFYRHTGVDYMAIARVLFTNVKEGRIAQGGSTLTMQLAKRLYSQGERSFARKLQDMALAVMIEREKTKDQILELYLNQVFYGYGAYGVSAAAKVYLGKELEELTVSDAALLARFVRRPSEENAFANLQKAIENRNTVLQIMREEGVIDEAQLAEALAETPNLRKKPKVGVAATKRAPYFVDYILERVHREFPDIDLSKGGYRIETSLDVKLQAIAERSVRDLVANNRHVTTAAFVLTDREGRILAMVGGADYDRNQFNVITQGRRQPGSAFKPIVYAAALENGALEPTSYLSNAKFTWVDRSTGRTWTPKNVNGKYGGPVSVRTAIAQSINLPAIRACEKATPQSVVSMARNAFGFRSKLDPVLPLALGASAVAPLEMARAYSVFMLGGDRFNPFGLRRIVGPHGDVVAVRQASISRNVLSPHTCELMDGFLRAVVTGGTGRRAASVVNARGKTGTTDDNRDAWFVGYTDQLLGVGWIANEVREGNNWVYQRMPGVFGGDVTVHVWRGVVGEAQKMLGEQPRHIKQPAEGRRPADDHETDRPDAPPKREKGDGSSPDDWVLPPLDPAPAAGTGGGA